jgi:hypothetical protein
MATRKHRRTQGRRKWDDYPVSHDFVGAASGTAEAYDIGNQFKTDYGYWPHQATLSIPRFDLSTVGTGTGTGLNFITVGFVVGPNTLDAVDLDPVANAREFWWVRKYSVQNNSNPAGILWAIQGEGGSDNWKVKTRRTLKALDDTLWMAVRPDFGGFTGLLTSANVHVGILYP